MHSEPLPAANRMEPGARGLDPQTHLFVSVIWVETELPHSGQPCYLVEDMTILGQVPHPELQHCSAKPKPDKEWSLLTLL